MGVYTGKGTEQGLAHISVLVDDIPVEQAGYDTGEPGVPGHLHRGVRVRKEREKC